ncbi:MAG: nucleotide exchange factor GrpE [Acidobacteriota bacterium]|nr:nucleotide exchange factor GrpE [Acidobacteriota bacterium]
MDSENDVETVAPVTDAEQSDFMLESTTAEIEEQPDETDETNETEATSVALEGLSQEVRRVGRELFKTNRAAGRNGEMFEEALAELQQLADALAQLPEQTAESVFQAKASLCRELIRLADTLEASLTAATDVLVRLEENAQQPATGIVFRFQAARQLRTALDDSVAAMQGWHDGQQLLVQRLLAILHAAGVRAIEAVGRPFDSTLYRAVAVERRSDVHAGIIVGEELRGYVLEGRVLRYPEVVVAKNE